MASPAWSVVGRPVRDGDPAAGDGRCRQKRGGVGQVGFDEQPSTAGPGPGSTRQASGTHRRRRRPTDRSAAPSSRCAACDGTGGPVVHDAHALLKDAAQSSSPETNCDDALASIRDVAAEQRPGAAHGERQRVAVDPGAERPAAHPSTVAIGRRRAAGSPSKTTSPGRRGRQRRQEPHHRAGQTAVDLRRSGAAGPARPRQSAAAPVASIDGAERAQRRRPSDRCPGCAARRRSDGPVACAARMSARLVSDFEPGTATVDRTGALAVGAAQPTPARAAARASSVISP